MTAGAWAEAHHVVAEVWRRVEKSATSCPGTRPCAIMGRDVPQFLLPDRIQLRGLRRRGAAGAERDVQLYAVPNRVSAAGPPAEQRRRHRLCRYRIDPR